MTDIVIPYNFTPRTYQIDLLKALDSGYKRAIAVYHRCLAENLVQNQSGIIVFSQYPVGFMLPTGTIKTVIAVGSTTGTWKHYIKYEPMSSSSLVTAGF